MNTATDLLGGLEGEYACLAIDQEEYGIRTAQVRSIAAIPAIRRVPRAPAFVAGVVNIGGRIVPLLDPVERFGLTAERVSTVDKKLVLVQLDRSLYGVMVDGISSITHLAEDSIEPVNPLMVPQQGAFIAAMARHGDRLIYLLDAEAFIRGDLEEDREKREAYEAFSAGKSASLERAGTRAGRRFLALAIGDEEYGVESSGLKGIVPASRMEKGAGGPDYLAGIVSSSIGTLPVLDLQMKFGLDARPYTEESRVVIVDTGPYAYGILAHTIRELLEIVDEEIKEVPAAISGDGASHLQGVGLLAGGERLVLLLDGSRVLEAEEVRLLAEREDIEMHRRERKAARREGGNALGFVVFKVRDVELAFRLDDLSEVVPYRQVTQVPQAPDFIRGLVAVRGELVPVLDLSRRLDLGAEEEQEGSRIVIVRKGETVYGVVADAVIEIARVAPEEVVPPPEILQGVEARFVEGVIQVEGTDRAPLVLDVEALIGA